MQESTDDQAPMSPGSPYMAPFSRMVVRRGAKGTATVGKTLPLMAGGPADTREPHQKQILPCAQSLAESITPKSSCHRTTEQQ